MLLATTRPTRPPTLPRPRKTGSGGGTSPDLEVLVPGRAGIQNQDFLKTFASCPNDFFFLAEKRKGVNQGK